MPNGHQVRSGRRLDLADDLKPSLLHQETLQKAEHPPIAILVAIFNVPFHRLYRRQSTTGLWWVAIRQTRASRFSQRVLARQLGVSHAVIAAERCARVAGKDRQGLIEQPLAGGQDDRCNHKVHVVDQASGKELTDG